MNRLFEAIDKLYAFTLDETEDINHRLNESDKPLVLVVVDDEYIKDLIKKNKSKIDSIYTDGYEYYAFVKGKPLGDYEYNEEDLFGDWGFEGDDIDELFLSNGDINKEFIIEERGLRPYKPISLTEDDELDLGDGKHVAIRNDDEALPYIAGYMDAGDEVEIADRDELSNEELWATGWIASVQNEDDRPFSSFNDIDLFCYDMEKGNEYNIPCKLPDEFKARFVQKVNNYVYDEE